MDKPKSIEKLKKCEMAKKSSVQDVTLVLFLLSVIHKPHIYSGVTIVE